MDLKTHACSKHNSTMSYLLSNLPQFAIIILFSLDSALCLRKRVNKHLLDLVLGSAFQFPREKRQGF